MKKIRLIYEIIMERTIRKLIRGIRYRKRLKKMRKENPHTYTLW